MLRTWTDAEQLAYNFLISQLTIIEPTIASVVYPDIQYPDLVPVVTPQGGEWAASITIISTDSVGQMQWFHAQSQQVPLVDITREKAERRFEMSSLGYSYDVQELNQSRMLGINITPDKAAACNRQSEEFLDNVALRGDATKNWKGLINDAGVTVVTNPADGTGSTTTWSTKTVDKILRDFNSVLSAVYSGSLQTELADTVLLPIDSLLLLGSTLFSTSTPITLLQHINENNTYTQITNRPLRIAAVRGLETAGSGSTKRMVAYRRDPEVVRFYLPMPFRFLPPWQRAPLVFDIPGIMRVGGVEIRRPGAFRYMDGI